MNMRNPDLDKNLPIDKFISDLQYDDEGWYRIVNGKKVYQLAEKTQDDKDMNLIINRVRASGMLPSEYLRMMYGPK